MNKKQPSKDLVPEKISEIVPILPLFDIILFPKMVLPLVVMQGESIKMIDEVMSKDRVLGFLSAKDLESKKNYKPEDLYTIGTTGTILKMAKNKDDVTQVMVQGLKRFKIKDFIEEKPYLRAQVEIIKDIGGKDKETEALMTNILVLYNKTRSSNFLLIFPKPSALRQNRLKTPACWPI